LAQLGSFLLLRLLVTFIKNTDQLQDLILFLTDCDSKPFSCFSAGDDATEDKTMLAIDHTVTGDKCRLSFLDLCNSLNFVCVVETVRSEVMRTRDFSYSALYRSGVFVVEEGGEELWEVRRRDLLRHSSRI